MIGEITRVGLAVAAVAVSAGTTGHGLGQAVAPAVRYLSQVPPGTTPARFAPGIVSQVLVINAVTLVGLFALRRVVAGAALLIRRRRAHASPARLASAPAETSRNRRSRNRRSASFVTSASACA